MKLFLVILLSLICFQLRAQNTISNNIASVKELNIYGKDASIVIGKIVVNNDVTPPSIMLIQTFQSPTPQSDGFYLTQFLFGTDNVVPLYNVNLNLKFNSPIDSLNVVGISYEIATNGGQLSDDKTDYSHIASEIHAMFNGKARFVINIKSKTRIVTTIKGVANSN